MTNCGHMITATNILNLLVTLCTEIMTSSLLLKNSFILRKLRVVNFAGIIKVTTIVITVTCETTIKAKKIKMLYLTVFPDITNIASYL